MPEAPPTGAAGPFAPIVPLGCVKELSPLLETNTFPTEGSAKEKEETLTAPPKPVGFSLSVRMGAAKEKEEAEGAADEPPSENPNPVGARLVAPKPDALLCVSADWKLLLEAWKLKLLMSELTAPKPAGKIMQ